MGFHQDTTYPAPKPIARAKNKHHPPDNAPQTTRLVGLPNRPVRGTKPLAGQRVSRLFIYLVLCWSLVVLMGCTLNSTPQPPTEDISVLLPTRFIIPTYTPIPSITPTFTPRPTSTPSPTPIPTPEPLTELVIITQALPQGVAIPPQAIGVVQVPLRSMPFSAITDVTQIVNRVTRVDLGCYEPIIEGVLAIREAGSGFLTFADCPSIPQAQQPFRMVNVVIATMYLPQDTQILPNMVALRPYPFHLIPLGALTNLSDVVGKTTRTDILREQPITDVRIAD
jgi:flagella basal body P-ring formation protein FlgA